MAIGACARNHLKGAYRTRSAFLLAAIVAIWAAFKVALNGPRILCLAL